MYYRKMELGLIILAIVCAMAEAYFDAKRILKGTDIEHKFSAFVRITVSYTASLALLAHPYWIIFGTMLLVIYWMVFDPFINAHRDLSPWYIGKTSKMDKFIRKHITSDGRHYLSIKALLLFVLFFLYKIQW